MGTAATRGPWPYARHNIPFGNIARIQLEALIDVIDEAAGKTERFVLIAPCRSEWVYAEDHLFQLPSVEYRNIYSLTKERFMGRSLTPCPSQKLRPRYPARTYFICEYEGIASE